MFIVYLIWKQLARTAFTEFENRTLATSDISIGVFTHQVYEINMAMKIKSRTMKSLEKMMGRPRTLGGLIEAIRRGEEMSLAVFSGRLEVSPSHLCDIEKGRKVVSPGRAARFAAVLERSSEQFVRLSLQGLLDEAGLKMKVSVARVK